MKLLFILCVRYAPSSSKPIPFVLCQHIGMLRFWYERRTELSEFAGSFLLESEVVSIYLKCKRWIDAGDAMATMGLSA